MVCDLSAFALVFYSPKTNELETKDKLSIYQLRDLNYTLRKQTGQHVCQM